jgi:hypothetical protein
VIVNAFSVLDAFTALLRAALGILLAAAGAVWLRRRGSGGGAGEERYDLLVVLATTLLVLAAASWPLFYLVLASYVPEWPGVMCIAGVTRIGLGSAGAAARLPLLANALEVLKPLLLFAAGAWFLLHRARRDAPRGGLAARAAAALLAFGLLGAVDGSTELAYLFTPKKERSLAVGCCTVGAAAVSDDPFGTAPPRLLGVEIGSAALTAAFVGACLLEAGLFTLALRRGRAAGVPVAAASALALLALPVAGAFFRHVAGPAYLGLPHHRCLYCLLPSAPEGILHIALLLLGAFGAGWAAVARFVAGVAPAPALLGAARFGWLAAAAMGLGRVLLP